MQATQSKKVLDPNLFIKYEHHMTNSLIIDAVVKRITRDNMSICDIGGATGVILNSIITKSNYKTRPFILDLFEEYKKAVVNKNIHYIVGSIINNKLESNKFDFVILRDVLHHLITGGIKEIKKSQEKAIKEMVRLTKPGGYIIFEEEINNSSISSLILFYLSSIAFKIRLGNLGFNAGKVIVSFMSNRDIEKVLKMYNGQLDIIKEKYIKWQFSPLWNATLLMNGIYRAFYIIKKKS